MVSLNRSRWEDETMNFRTALVMAASMIIAGSDGARASLKDLEVVGTGDGLAMLRAIAEAYNGDQTSVRIVVPKSIGSGGGILAVASDRARLGRIARPLKASEKASGLVEVPIARMPSAFFVHPSTGITRLTNIELTRLFDGTITSWRTIGGADTKVRLVRREESDSTLRVLRTSVPGWDKLTLSKRSKLAMTTQEAIETVKTVPGAIGFGPYSRDLDKVVNVLSVDERSPLDPGYPSAVTLSLIFKGGRKDEEISSFLAFCRTKTAAEIIARFGAAAIPQR